MQGVKFLCWMYEGCVKWRSVTPNGGDLEGGNIGYFCEAWGLLFSSQTNLNLGVEIINA